MERRHRRCGHARFLLYIMEPAASCMVQFRSWTRRQDELKSSTWRSFIETLWVIDHQIPVISEMGICGTGGSFSQCWLADSHISIQVVSAVGKTLDRNKSITPILRVHEIFHLDTENWCIRLMKKYLTGRYTCWAPNPKKSKYRFTFYVLNLVSIS